MCAYSYVEPVFWSCHRAMHLRCTILGQAQGCIRSSGLSSRQIQHARSRQLSRQAVVRLRVVALSDAIVRWPRCAATFNRWTRRLRTLRTESTLPIYAPDTHIWPCVTGLGSQGLARPPNPTRCTGSILAKTTTRRKSPRPTADPPKLGCREPY